MTGPFILGSDIPPGHYVCVRTSGFLAWVIRKATKSEYDHVFVTGPGGVIAEATLRGVHLSLLSEYAGHQACANVAEAMTPSQCGEVWAAAEAMCGEPYSYPDLLAIAAADLGWHWNLMFKMLNAQPWRICSQLAVMAGACAAPPLNWRPLSDQYAGQATPGQLALRPGVRPVTLT